MRRRVDVSGVSLAVTDEGTGPAVLFVHGMGLDQRMWAPQIGPVDALRAAGDHVRPARPRRVRRARDRLSRDRLRGRGAGLLDALGIERAHIVGLSLGGSVVARLAVRHPERIRSVTVIGSMASGYPALTDFIKRGGTAALVMDGRMDLETYRRERLSSFLYAPTLADPVAGPLAREILAEALRTTAVLTETTAERIAGWPPPTDWDLWIDPDRPVPALVLAGSMDDPTFQGFARDSADLPRSHGAIVEGSAHLANMSHPHVVDPLLLEHLDAAERDRP